MTYNLTTGKSRRAALVVKYLHISNRPFNGGVNVVMSKGETFNAGRNAAKRAA